MVKEVVVGEKEEIRRFFIKKLIEELKRKKGRGTELISLYIPAGRPIADVMNMLREEYSTATNIKDRTTRHHVLDALTTIMQRLKYFRTTPPNGLVIFAGYVSRGAPGSEKMEVYVIEPPEKLTTYLYRCDSRFYTEILEEMVNVNEVYGLVVIDRNEAAFGILKGKRVEVLEVITSGVPGKHSAGGQSQRRFDRIIEQLAHEFYKRVGEHMKKHFLNMPNLKGIIIGGPGPTKQEFYEGDYIHYMLKKKVIAVLDTGYSGEEGIYELAKRAVNVLKDTAYAREKKMMQKFLELVVRESDKVVYGVDDVVKALEMGAVDTLLISEALEGKVYRVTCNSCGTNDTLISVKGYREITPPKTCPRCGNPVKVEEEDLLKYLVTKAEEYGTKVELISTDTEEGKMFKQTFGGIAGILRFKIH